jgi:hypothetical protein
VCCSELWSWSASAVKMDPLYAAAICVRVFLNVMERFVFRSYVDFSLQPHTPRNVADRKRGPMRNTSFGTCPLYA